MSIKEHLVFLVEASERYQKEEKSLKKSHGINDNQKLDFNSPNTAVFLKEENIVETEIKKYLEGLNYNELFAVYLLFNLGRDRTDLELLKQFLQGESPEAMLEAVYGKIQLYPIYFRIAEILLQKNNIDMEMLLE